ncbi:MAG: DeoR/GlpR family DNA-binding transcription regulator [Lacrimispora sp.]|uniref:DeoR/GlpR family DNA-binding transcription regulator n=1 Tax=Lacrimispora sp. TaxID=2719234 RepID=UPI0039E3C3FD
MSNFKRENEILELLKEINYATVEFLASKLYASPSSIRRDLTNLENQGYVRRSRGGVTLLAQSAGLAPFALRKQESKKEKMIIARKAITLIKPDSAVFFDSSTTAMNFAFLIKPEWNITAYTNNLHMAHLLAAKHIKTYAAGGLVSDRDYVITTGPYALELLKNIYVDQMFFTSSSLNEDGKITDVSEKETEVRKFMLKQAKKRVFLCPFERFGKMSEHLVTTLESVECIVSDQKLPQSFRDRFSHIQFLDAEK